MNCEGNYGPSEAKTQRWKLWATNRDRYSVPQQPGPCWWLHRKDHQTKPTVGKYRDGATLYRCGWWRQLLLSSAWQTGYKSLWDAAWDTERNHLMLTGWQVNKKMKEKMADTSVQVAASTRNKQLKANIGTQTAWFSTLMSAFHWKRKEKWLALLIDMILIKSWFSLQLFAMKRSYRHCFSGAPCCSFTWPGSSLGDSLEPLPTERFFAASAFQMRHSNKTKKEKKTCPLMTRHTSATLNVKSKQKCILVHVIFIFIISRLVA